jgi:hypothetical protein
MKSIHPFTRIKKNIQSTLLVIVLLASFLSGSLPAVQAQEGNASELFSDAGNARPAVKQEPQPFVVRSRYVNVNFGLLLNEGRQSQDAGSKPEIELNLFPDVTYTGVIDQIKKNSSNSSSWIGTIKDQELGYFYLVISDGVFIAHIASPTGIYEVSSVGDDLYQVIQIDQSQFSEGNDTREPPDYHPIDITAPEEFGATGGGTKIDVMILYTSAARFAEGSVAAMNARVDLAVTESNASYTNSGVTPWLNLVYKGEVSYAESGDMSADLDRITFSDGIMDEVLTLRDTYGADLVQLVVETGSYCGIGWFMSPVSTSFAPYGFSVVLRSGCMTGNYSSGHEFGHNQSAHHDIYVNSGTTPYPYNHGYVNLSARWRTVMAYNNQCADTAPYTYCTRLQYWSNPTKTYGGAVMGVTSLSENYLVLNNTASTVASFRQSSTPTTFNISGNAGIGGATLSYTDGAPQTATADSAGLYSFSVSSGWSGTVTPSKTGYTFTPASKSYTNVLADQTGQNYAAAVPIVNLLQDPSFESYTPNTYWLETSTNFVTPLCTVADCTDGAGTAGPRTGSVWGWFGGTTKDEASSLAQTVDFPTGTANLQFYLWIGRAESGRGASDQFSVTIDGVTVFTADATQINSFSSYTMVNLDVSSFADGASHIIMFAANTSGQMVNFNLDDITLATAIPTFADVPLDYWARSYIERLYNSGITRGCGVSPLTYCPLDSVTRTQMAIFILRGIHGSGYIPAEATGTVFSDVSTSTFGAAWIEQFALEGITSGCGSGKFCPDEFVTRAQIAIFLLKGKHGSTYIPPAATGDFADVPIGSFAADWIEQLALEGITSGCGGGNYCPNSNVLRDQMAVFLVRTFNLP